jgi:hypothetical protein
MTYTPSKRDLIDLAIEYDMIRSTPDFYEMSEKAQRKILEVIKKIADQLEWVA